MLVQRSLVSAILLTLYNSDFIVFFYVVPGWNQMIGQRIPAGWVVFGI